MKKSFYFLMAITSILILYLWFSSEIRAEQEVDPGAMLCYGCGGAGGNWEGWKKAHIPTQFIIPAGYMYGNHSHTGQGWDIIVSPDPTVIWCCQPTIQENLGCNVTMESPYCDYYRLFYL